MVQTNVSGPPRIKKIIINISDIVTRAKQSLFKHLTFDDSTVTYKKINKIYFKTF